MGLTQVHSTHAHVQTAFHPFIQDKVKVSKVNLWPWAFTDSFVQLLVHSQYCYTKEFHWIPLRKYQIKWSFSFSSLCKLALSRLPTHSVSLALLTCLSILHEMAHAPDLKEWLVVQPEWNGIVTVAVVVAIKAGSKWKRYYIVQRVK